MTLNNDFDQSEHVNTDVLTDVAVLADESPGQKSDGESCTERKDH